MATFRQDVGYSDGRHPDRIAFSSPELDAQRHFTINGMFYNPLENRIIDFVGGEADLVTALCGLLAMPGGGLRRTSPVLRRCRLLRSSIFA